MDKFLNVGRLLISGLVAGLVSGGVAFVAVLQEAKAERLADISDVTWAIIIAGGLLVTLKDWQTYLKKPPEVGSVSKLVGPE